LLPVIQEFLVKYIQTWDGIEHQDAIFKLLSFLRPEPFERRLSKNTVIFLTNVSM